MRNKILIACLLNFSSMGSAQSDSVYLHKPSQLMDYIEIVSFDGIVGVRENYQDFKGQLWLLKTDTISLQNFVTEPKKKKKDNKSYKLYNQCDSTINAIRNRAAYWEMRNRIDKFSRKQIGVVNIEFISYKHSKEFDITNFHSNCSNTFLENLNVIEKQLLEKIESIHQQKIQTYNFLTENYATIPADYATAIIKTFDTCTADFKSIEFLMLNRYDLFYDVIQKMTEVEFNRIESKLRFLPYTKNTARLTNFLKNQNRKNLRTKRIYKVLKKIKVKNQKRNV